MNKLVNRPKAELIIELYSVRNDSSGRAFLGLLETLTDEIRAENDNAPVKRVIRNQGKLAMLSQLREYIERGQPSLSKTS